MDVSVAKGKQDESKIRKLNAILSEDGFWDKAGKIAKGTTSLKNLKRLYELSEMRLDELNGHKRKPYELILYADGVPWGCKSRDYTESIFARGTFTNSEDLINSLYRIASNPNHRVLGRAASVWKGTECIYAGEFFFDHFREVENQLNNV